MYVNSLASLRQHVMTHLGSPVICVELAPQQIDSIAYESIEELYRYLYGEAVIKHWIGFKVMKGVSEYHLDESIQDVVDFDMESAGMAGGINALFSAENTLLYNTNMYQGLNPTSTFSGQDQGDSLSYFAVSKHHLDTIEYMFRKKFICIYSELEQKLTINPAPDHDGWGLLNVWSKVAADKLYNHVSFKKLVVARCKKLWGMILGKYQVTLPGGGTIAGTEIASIGATEEQEVFADMKKESAPCYFIVG